MRIRGAFALAAVLVSAGCASTRPAARGDRQEGEVQESQAKPIGPFWQDAETLSSRCDAALAEAARLRDALKAAAPSAAGADADVLTAFNAMSHALDTASGWAGLMFSVHPDKAVREAGQTCQERLAAFNTEVMLDRGLFDAVAAVDTTGLDALAKRFVERLLRDFRRSGVDQDEATRARLAEIDKEMVRIGQQYQQNIREDVRSVTADPEELAGLPEDYITAHPPGDDGKITITTDYPEFFPIQTYAESGALRQRLYEVFMSRGHPKNGPLIQRLLTLRHEYATTLGHPTWAAYTAEDKMARSPETIEAFIKQVASIARPRMKRDLATLLKAKRKDVREARKIEVWDRFYYVGKVRQAEHDFDSKAVRPYFPFVQVRQGILDLYAELFGLRFVRDEAADVWHPQVEAIDMFTGDELVGRFYLDMHPREGKYKHAAMFPIRTGLEGADLPMGSLVCNFPAPADAEGHALMEHEDVVTFFHEFGHLIHHMLARRGPWVSLSGIHVEWDFVEAPSQILEEWAWDATVLQRFAKHVETGEPISADQVQRMRAAEEFGKGVHVMRQVFYTAYSYFLHATEPSDLDLEAFTDAIYADYSPYGRVPNGRVYENFGHLIGYSSMYYTYQWSLVIAKDMFTRFKSEGLLNQDVARAYREAILEPGGTRDASDLVERFLGRPFGLDAYRDWLESD